MGVDTGLVDWVSEALEPDGSVSMRKMMGGATLYLDGVVFAIVFDDRLWFKADAESDPQWDAADCPRFVFTMKGEQRVSMNYRAAPDEVYDDADTMREWAALAVAAGLRGAAKKKPRKRAG